VHGGLGWGIHIKSSGNVLIDNTAIIGFRPIGVNIVSTTGLVEFTNNIVADVIPRDSFGSAENLVDVSGCLLLCSYEDPHSCSSMKVSNNIVAGCEYTGMTVPGHDCGDTSAATHTITNNVVHSINMNGVIVFPDPARSSSSTCYQGSGHTVYKT